MTSRLAGPRIAVLVLIVATSGCSYTSARLADLSDVITAELTAGRGADVHMEVTSLLGASLGLSRQRGPMLQGRHAGTGERETVGMLLTGYSDVSGDSLEPLYGDLEYVPRRRAWLLLLRMPPHAPFHPGREWPRSLDIGVGGSLLVGVHLGFSPIEAVDFLLGFTTIDIVGDDHAPASVDEDGTVAALPQATGKGGP